jgi:uncharacterized protein affecting Mg2+/Co2+ transport
MTPVYRIDASNRHNDRNMFMYRTNWQTAQKTALNLLRDYDIVTITDTDGTVTRYTVTYEKEV